VSAIDTLFERRAQPARWLFVVAALPLIIFALIGANYGAFVPYAVLAGICVIQFVRPTLLGWGVVMLVFAVGASLYLYTATADLVRLARGQQPQLFLNPYDTAAFTALIVLVVAVAVGLFFLRPRRSVPS
jgi:hypothetical protein